MVYCEEFFFFSLCKVIFSHKSQDLGRVSTMEQGNCFREGGGSDVSFASRGEKKFFAFLDDSDHV